MNVRFLLLVSLVGFFVFALAGDARAGGRHRHGRDYAVPMTPGVYWGSDITHRHSPVDGYYRSRAYHRGHAFYGGSAAKQRHSRHAVRHDCHVRHGRHLRH